MMSYQVARELFINLNKELTNIHTTNGMIVAKKSQPIRVGRIKEIKKNLNQLFNIRLRYCFRLAVYLEFGVNILDMRFRCLL